MDCEEIDSAFALEAAARRTYSKRFATFDANAIFSFKRPPLAFSLSSDLPRDAF
jgi:hypothetical protein